MIEKEMRFPLEDSQQENTGRENATPRIRKRISMPKRPGSREYLSEGGFRKPFNRENNSYERSPRPYHHGNFNGERHYLNRPNSSNRYANNHYHRNNDDNNNTEGARSYGSGRAEYNSSSSRYPSSYERRTPYDGENSYHRSANRFSKDRSNEHRPYYHDRDSLSSFPKKSYRTDAYHSDRDENAQKIYYTDERRTGRNTHFVPKRPLNPIPQEVIRYKDETTDPSQPIRLNKYLANSGICSRRDADAYIQAGMVKVNDVTITELGTKVLRSDTVKFKDKVITIGDKVYVLLNKPKNCVTTSEDPQGRKTVMEIVKDACPERIYPVGRLDRNTTGVLLLTNDGELASQLTHPKFLKKKIYHVFLDREIDEETMERIRTGIKLEDGEIKADAVEYAEDDDKTQVGIEIHSGRNRIVRRIFESLGFHVVKLDRVYFAGLTKKNLKRGQWRYLEAKEVSMLKMGAFE